MKKYIFSFFFLLPVSLWSQDKIVTVISDSIHILDQMNESVDLEITNRIASQNSFLTSLDNQSFATLRSGGPSVLSTLLHRGMASRHIAILWGGFNIQSIVNGTFDLNLVANTFDRAKFYGSGTSTVTGNASIAGAISLRNNLFKEKETTLNLSISTANNKVFSLINKATFKKYHHHFAFTLNSNENQYAYKYNGVKFKQNAAAFSIWDLNYEAHLMLSENLSIGGGVWLQNATRNIPSTKTSVGIKQEQADNNYRGFLQMVHYISDDARLKFRSGYFDETIDYKAPGILSLANSDIFNSALDYLYKDEINLSIQYRNDKVKASFYLPIHERNTIAFLAGWKKKIRSFEIGASIRPEWVDKEIQPLVLSVRIKSKFSENLSASFNYNKGYTLPSFNDLYWPAGGNPNLKTERSHEFDIGFAYKSNASKKDILSVNLFYNLIDDWIQWSPIDGLFVPVNQRKVRNIGLEVRLDKKYKLSADSHFGFSVIYALTDSKLVAHYLDSSNNGKRSIFVPLHKVTSTLSIDKNTWQLLIKPLFYSKRYDTVDNSSYVSGFMIFDFEVIKIIKTPKINMVLSLAVDNGLNNDYENIRFYPMPLRIFRIGANFKI